MPFSWACAIGFILWGFRGLFDRGFIIHLNTFWLVENYLFMEVILVSKLVGQMIGFKIGFYSGILFLFVKEFKLKLILVG